MHKEYIKIPMNIRVDYIPTSGLLCGNCIFKEICPYDYKCQTYKRTEEYEDVDNDYTDLRDE